VKTSKPSRKTPAGRPHRTTFYLLLVIVGVLACFHPVTKYFFAQDDFILLANVVFDRGSTLGITFGAESDLFRPLTKVVYFGVMHGIFGLNPFPYHLASLLVHALNVLLVFALLRRFHFDRISSLVASSFFAFHMAFFDVVAWISCIQQLAGQAFMLAGLILGVRAMATRRQLFVVLAVCAYVLALLSLEQTYALALLLFLHAYLREKTGSSGGRARRALRETFPYLIVMALYLLYMAAAKGIPGEGPYRYSFGTNIISNLLTYLDWVFAFSVVMPFAVDSSPTGLTTAHVVLALLVVYNLAKGRRRTVIFACAYYATTILPVLFLQGHTFYLHDYVPAVGIVLLVAPVLEDFFKAVQDWKREFAPLAAAGLVILAMVVCYTKVRTNETSYIRPDLPLPKNFVLRRELVARNSYNDLMMKTRASNPPKNLFLVYTGKADWYKDNVMAALGRSSALKLFYSEPRLNVAFLDKGEQPRGFDPRNSAILYFDYTGHCMTPDEAGEPGVGPAEPAQPE
jgi:hypothetical protein